MFSRICQITFEKQSGGVTRIEQMSLSKNNWISLSNEFIKKNEFSLSTNSLPNLITELII